MAVCLLYKGMESIERYGILNPLIVMPTREGVYQIVSGHRRKYCAEKLGYTQVPVIIRYMKEEDSIISMVDSNLHRDKILFSEKAFAYYMKNEAMKRKTGKRRRTQEGQLESIKGTKTIQLIGKETGESPRQVLRYIRLTLLVPELLDMLDEGKISFNPAVELSFLSEVEQKWVLNGMDYAQAAPSVSQAKRIKALSQEKKLTQQKINEILSEIKKSDMSRVIFKKGNKKTFVLIYDKDGYVWINVKCDPEWREFWRNALESVVPAYHMNKTHWNSIILDGSVPDKDIQRMIGESYDLTKGKKK